MPERSRAVKYAVLTFVVGAALLAAVGAVTLTHAPPRLVLVGAPGIKGVGPGGINGTVYATDGDPTICQAGEVLPSGVSAIRLSMWAFFGARVRVGVYDGSRLLTEGARGADWTSDSVTVPVRPLAHTTTGVRLCFALGPNSEPITVIGSPAPSQQAAEVTESRPEGERKEQLHGRVAVEYVASGQGSWWSRIMSVARHMGLGRSFSGTWIALMAAALMAATALLAVRLTLRELSS